jgi:hypothetical protein
MFARHAYVMTGRKEPSPRHGIEARKVSFCVCFSEAAIQAAKLLQKIQ